MICVCATETKQLTALNVVPAYPESREGYVVLRYVAAITFVASAGPRSVPVITTCWPPSVWSTQLAERAAALSESEVMPGTA